jgi:hypothetical protein
MLIRFGHHTVSVNLSRFSGLFAVMTLLLFAQISFAQVQKKPWTIGPEIANNGFGVNFTTEISKADSETPNLLSIGLTTLKHQKEVKVQNPNFINPKPYIYGKLNSAAALRVNYGIAKTLTQKTSSPSVSLGIQFGPSIAIIKPYYVYTQELDNQRFNPTLSIQSPDKTATQENVLGSAGWTEGLNELSTQYGLHIDVNIITVWNHTYRKQRTKSGVRMDYFFSNLNLMHEHQNQLFLSYYLSYQIGENGL